MLENRTESFFENRFDLRIVSNRIEANRIGSNQIHPCAALVLKSIVTEAVASDTSTHPVRPDAD